MTPAHDRYRLIPTTERVTLVCDDCRDNQGWRGVDVFTSDTTPDLAALITAADAHEAAAHPTGCRCEPYDCNHGDDEEPATPEVPQTVTDAILGTYTAGATFLAALHAEQS